MNNTNNKKKVIGVSGFARAGKDTFVRIASKILNNHGYTTSTLAFATGLKDDLDGWLKEKYGISAWTNNAEEKKLIRPLLVAHGCGKRAQTDGKYWIDKVDEQLKKSKADKLSDNHVYFVSDLRFPNEEKWLHEQGGWLVHLRKYTMVEDTDCNFDYESHPELDGVDHPEQYFPDDYIETKVTRKKYDEAPNDEEAKNDPLVQFSSDFKLELENVIEHEKALGNIITVDELVDNEYLNTEITKCLAKCPFLKLT